MSEQQIQSKIIDALNKAGAYVIKTTVSNHAGVPDIIACLDGRFIGIEVKDLKGKVSPIQEFNLSCIRRAGGIGIVVKSVQDVVALLEDGNGIDKFQH